MVEFIFGAERGIRTLERVLTVTRFPIVRLRPAQPSLQLILLYLSNIIDYNSFFENVKHFFSPRPEMFRPALPPPE